MRERKRKRGPKLRVIAGGGETTIGPHGGYADEVLIPPTARPADGRAAAPSLHARTAAGPLPPRKGAAEEKFIRHYYEHQHERRRVSDNVDRLRHAIVDLAAIELPPSRLLQELSPTFDRPVIRERLLRAIDCLSHFAEAWCREETTKPPTPSRRTGESGDS